MPSADAVTVSVASGPSASVPWTAGMNAQQALEKIWDAFHSEAKFTYALQYFGSQMGYQVVMINGTYATFPNRHEQESQPYFFWEFTLNGVPAAAGIDKTMLRPGDTISFALQAYIPGQKAGH
jgi:hypothetical protein